MKGTILTITLGALILIGCNAPREPREQNDTSSVDMNAAADDGELGAEAAKAAEEALDSAAGAMDLTDGQSPPDDDVVVNSGRPKE